MAPISFSTVTPGGNGTSTTVLSDAVASQRMSDTGTLVASKLWLDVEGIGNVTGSMKQLGDLSTADYALTLKNYATIPGGPTGNSTDGIVAHVTSFGVQGFGVGDMVYFDAQLNNLTQQLFDGRFTQIVDGGNLTGGLQGQNTLSLGTAVGQLAGTANIGLGLFGNTNNIIYPTVIDLSPNELGFATAHLGGITPLIMG